MEISKVDLQRIISVAVENSLTKFCQRSGIKIKDELSQTQAFRIYGEASIRKWEQTKKITPKIIGNNLNAKKRYSIAQIEAQIELEKIL